MPVSVKADRTIVVFGVFLFLIGFAVAWNGYGYIQIERGWSMVISGTIAFCSGLILIALGLLLRQLQILSASAAQSTLFLAKAKNEGLPPHPLAPLAAAPLPAGLDDEQEPIAAEAQVQGALETPDFGSATARGLGAPSPAPASESPAPQPPAWMTRASGYAALFAAAKVPDAPDVGEKQPETDSLAWMEEALAEHAATIEAHHEASFDEALPESEIHEEMAPAALPEMTFSEIHVEAPVESPLEHFETPAADLHEIEPSPEYETDFGREAEVRAHGETAQEREPETGHEPKPEPEVAEGPAVMGQYEAHGARYTMYVDGSIDAETAHGVYHFSSMDELKRFIEQSE